MRTCAWSSIRKTGCITSLFDKKASFEALAPGACGNQLQAFKDLPKQYDAWNIDPGTLDQPPALLTQADAVEVVEKGPMRGVIRVTRHWQNSKFVQQIVLNAGSDEAEVVNDIDWHETHVLLKAAFPLVGFSAIRNLRNSLREHRAADHAQQQLGEGSLRSAGAALGRSRATGSMA